MSGREERGRITPEAVGEDFIGRWSRLKLEPEPTPPLAPEPASEEPPVPPGDDDMPPLSSLDESSDYSGFFSERVSEALRQQALRKLFHSPSLNLCDGLDDYAEDFTSFIPLGDIITADMRHQLVMAEERARQSAGEEPAAEDEPATNEQDVAEEAMAGESTEAPAAAGEVRQVAEHGSAGQEDT
ncbi:MAG: DUF3306 domain-containing protein [Sedimenticola sp.]|nr:DUF3306 domain-containing protein [Sedimenticola sp.]